MNSAQRNPVSIGNTDHRNADFAYMWQYVVDGARLNEFREACGPNGTWVQLFSRDPNFVETVLLCDANDGSRFITIDYWSTRSSGDAFRKKFSKELSLLDAQCNAYTVTETFLGDFDVSESSR